MDEVRISTAKAAKKLGVHPKTVVRLIHRGVLKGWNMAPPDSLRPLYTVDEADLEIYIEKRRLKIAPRS